MEENYSLSLYFYMIFSQNLHVNALEEGATEYLYFCFKMLFSKYITQVPTDAQ